VPYRRKKLTFAISSPDEFLLYITLQKMLSLLTDNALVIIKILAVFQKELFELW